MSGDKTPLICWDSCIFLAWFNQENDKNLGAIAHFLQLIANGKLTLLVSALSYAEVLDRAGQSDAGSQFREFVKRPNVILANVDARIGLLAAEIREATLAALREGKINQSVKIPDAIIAATAVVYQAKILHSYDPVLREISGWPVIRGLPMEPPATADGTQLILGI